MDKSVWCNSMRGMVVVWILTIPNGPPSTSFKIQLVIRKIFCCYSDGKWWKMFNIQAIVVLILCTMCSLKCLSFFWSAERVLTWFYWCHKDKDMEILKSKGAVYKKKKNLHLPRSFPVGLSKVCVSMLPGYYSALSMEMMLPGQIRIDTSIVNGMWWSCWEWAPSNWP